MDRRTFLKNFSLSAGALTLGGCATNTAAVQTLFARGIRPNIVYILADDLGYGDLSCLNSDSKIHTPNLDQLARDGMIFTDAHSGSAVCTPTRYGILTGRYCWRSRLKKGVLAGTSPHLIEPGRLTVASVLRTSGYHTACIGKWHLGWDWTMRKDKPNQIDFDWPIQNGPRTNGFDYGFCIPASLDMPPYVYVENERVTAIPDRTIDGQTGKILLRKGLIAPDLTPGDVLPTITRKAVSYIDQRAKQKSPFFLYFPLTAPHTPILPTPEFQGKSKTSEYGDFVLQVDWTVGQVLETLKRNGLERDTLVIFTSDNGFAPAADLDELRQLGHNPSYIFRGHKADIFEGGHRIPYITRWPGHIKPGSISADPICLTDLAATAAEIVRYDLPANAAEDSVSILPDMLGTAKGPLREAIVHHSVEGSFSIRQGRWKLELCPGSGGWSYPRPDRDQTEHLPPVQLYDLEADIAETNNVQDRHPEIVTKLTALLQKYIDQGRSTPGLPQKNDGEISL